MVNIRRVEAEWTGLTGSPFLSVWNFRNEPGEANAYALAVEAFLEDIAHLVHESLEVRIEPVQTIFDDSTGQPTGAETASVATSPTMTGTGTLKSAATQGLLQLRTGVYAAGREIRGRLFIPAPTEALGDAMPDPSYVADLTTAGNNLISAMTSTTAWVVYSRARAQSADVTSTSGWNQYAVLRSRRD